MSGGEVTAPGPTSGKRPQAAPIAEVHASSPWVSTLTVMIEAWPYWTNEDARLRELSVLASPGEDFKVLSRYQLILLDKP